MGWVCCLISDFLLIVIFFWICLLYVCYLRFFAVLDVDMLLVLVNSVAIFLV